VQLAFFVHSSHLTTAKNIQPIPNFPKDNYEEVGYNFERSYVLDYNRKNLDKRHVIIPFDQFINFIDSNFVYSSVKAPSLPTKGKHEAYQHASTASVAVALERPSKLTSTTKMRH
jgi:hypothetical protein